MWISLALNGSADYCLVSFTIELFRLIVKRNKENIVVPVTKPFLSVNN